MTVAQLTSELLARHPKSRGLSNKTKDWFVQQLGDGSVWTTACRDNDFSKIPRVSAKMTIFQLKTELLARQPHCTMGLSKKTKDWFLRELGMESVWMTSSGCAAVLPTSNHQSFASSGQNARTKTKTSKTTGAKSASKSCAGLLNMIDLMDDGTNDQDYDPTKDDTHNDAHDDTDLVEAVDADVVEDLGVLVEELLANREDRRTICNHCGIEEKDAQLFLCGDCRRATYCSRECQHAAWEDHKTFCIAETKRRKTAKKKKAAAVPKEAPVEKMTLLPAQKMKVRELKTELLEEHGIDPSHFLEKQELVHALEQARAKKTASSQDNGCYGKENYRNHQREVAVSKKCDSSSKTTTTTTPLSLSELPAKRHLLHEKGESVRRRLSSVTQPIVQPVVGAQPRTTTGGRARRQNPPNTGGRARRQNPPKVGWVCGKRQ